MKNINSINLLKRKSIWLNNQKCHELIKNQVILVTGGGGSIGSQLCRQIIKYNPKALIILDNYENNLYEIEVELKNLYPNHKIEAIIANIQEKDHLNLIFEQYKPKIIFHAAAHKHVPLMENNPLEAINNNVWGTYNLIECADKYQADKFIFISTDKAINPTSVMGATKRLGEMMIEAKTKISKTNYIAVRFCNVIESNGSVVQLFKKQIINGGPITLTHENITRYFMTIEEAVELIIEATTYAKKGEIFILNINHPIKILDIAQRLIKLSKVKQKIKIKVIGLRPGEKLHEELISNKEQVTSTNNSQIFIVKSQSITWTQLKSNLKSIKNLKYNQEYSKEKIKTLLKLIVEDYKPY